MSCCGTNPGYDELDEVSRLVAAKLAAFLKTLRDAGFAVGLQEGQDAASLMAAGYAAKPACCAPRSSICSRRANPTGTVSTASSMCSGSASGCARAR